MKGRDGDRTTGSAAPTLRTIRSLLLALPAIGLALGFSAPPQDGSARNGEQAGANGELVEPPPIAEPPRLRPDAHLLLWRAGRGQLVGLPGARTTEREAERTAAMAELSAEIGGSFPIAALWMGHLAGLLASPETDDELWCAAARVVGELRRYEHAPLVAAGLDGGLRPRRHAAAVRALHGLYGRWFRTGQEAEPFMASVAAGEGTRLLLEETFAREREANTHLLRTLGHEPSEAPQWLESPDPAVRAGAARIVANEAVAAEILTPAAALDVLLPRLEIERDVLAYEATMEAVLGLVENAPPGDPEVVRLGGILAATVARAPDERSLSAARTTARLSWDMEPEPGVVGFLDAVGWVGEVLDALRAADTGRGASDPDAILGAMGALQVLCDRVEGDMTQVHLRRHDVRLPIFEILQDPRQALDVRVEAVGLLAHFTSEDDADLLNQVLSEIADTTVLAHALLGALPSILGGFDPEHPRTGEIMTTVAALSGSRDPDLRRRALSLLGSENLAPLTAALDPANLADILVRRLGAEEVPDLRQSILGLIRRFGGPAMLQPLLELENFDELATGDLGGVAELSEALRTLADGRADETVAVATRLVDVVHDRTRLSRVQRALTLVAGLAEERASELTPAQNDLVGAWAWELHEAGVSIADALPEGGAFRRRMAEIHLVARSEEPHVNGAAPLFPEAARQHLLGVYLGEEAAGVDPPPDPAPAEAAFASALEQAVSHPDPGFGHLVLRDRARFRAGRGDRLRALEDYRALVDTGALALSDLRQAVAMIAAVAGADPAAQTSAAPERCDLLDSLVGRPSWRSEPAAVRMEDLRQLAASTHVCPPAERPARLQALVARFADLPAERPENGTPPENPPLWYGLGRDDASFAELVALRDAAQAALAPAPETPGEAPPADEGGGDAEAGGGGSGENETDGGS